MKPQGMLRDLLWASLALGVLVLLPVFAGSPIVIDFVIRLAAFGIFATSLNLLVGYGGMVSFGHAMFLVGCLCFCLDLAKAFLVNPRCDARRYCFQCAACFCCRCDLCAAKRNLFSF